MDATALDVPKALPSAGALEAAEDALAMGDLAAGRVQADAAIALAQEAGDLRAEWHAQLAAARCAKEAHQHARAAVHVSSARDLALQLGDATLLAWAAVVGAACNLALGDVDAAVADLEAARTAAEAVAEPRLSIEFHCTLSHVQTALAQTAEALDSAHRAHAVAAQVSDPRWSAMALGNLGGRCFAHGYGLHAAAGGKGAPGNLGGQTPAQAGQAGRALLEQACEVCEAAIAAAQAARALRLNLSILNNLAGAQVALGRFDDARTTFERHAQLAQSLGLLSTRPNVLISEIRLHRRLGDKATARARALEGIALAEKLRQEQGLQGQTLKGLGLLHLQLSQLDEEAGDFAQALAHFKRYHDLEEAVGSATAEVRAQVLEVRMNTERAQREAALARERVQVLDAANAMLRAQSESLSREALSDALTGLANRRHLESFLTTWHAQARDARSPACAAFIDVDHFKQINDRHSHAVGDHVLQHLARILLRHCRKGDLAGRYGGEEFLLCLNGTTPAQAEAACERLREAVAGHDWHPLAAGLQVTISIGLADLASHPTPHEGLQAADARLYQAKAMGRNRVCNA